MWQKYGSFLLNCTKTSADCFVLEVSAVSRFQNRICIASIITAGHDKENKVLYIFNEEMRAATIDSQ